jgi:hypothetical protein
MGNLRRSKVSDKEIEDACVDIKNRYRLKEYEYQDILKDSLEESRRIHNYYVV